MESKKQKSSIKSVNPLMRLNEHIENNKIYYALLEFSSFFGLIYLISVGDQRLIEFLQIPWLTSHVSNLMGTILLMVLFSGKATFKSPKNKRLYLIAGSLIIVNLLLEFSRPIDSLWLPFNGRWEQFNTPDPLDALYGILGVLIVLVVVKISHRKYN